MKRNILVAAAKAFDLPTDIVAGLPRVEILGMRQILIENHRGILNYDTRQVAVSGGAVTLLLKGEGFVIKAMNARELRLDGVLFSLEIEY